MMEHSRANTHAPDFGVRVLSEEALRRSEGVVVNNIRTTINIDGHNFPPVGRLDLCTDVALVYGIAAPRRLLGRIAGLSGGHRVSPYGDTGLLLIHVRLYYTRLPRLITEVALRADRIALSGYLAAPPDGLRSNARFQARTIAGARHERSNCLVCQGGLVYFFSFAPPGVARVSDVSA